MRHISPYIGSDPCPVAQVLEGGRLVGETVLRSRYQLGIIVYDFRSGQDIDAILILHPIVSSGISPVIIKVIGIGLGQCIRGILQAPLGPRTTASPGREELLVFRQYFIGAYILSVLQMIVWC